MKKIESLKKLREIVEAQPENLAHGEYYNMENGQCCVVGHMLKANGASVEQLIALDQNLYGAGDYTVSAIMESAREGHHVDEESDFVTRVFTELGFNMEEDERLFTKIQQENDSSNGDKKHVIAVIDEEISRLENKINKTEE